jgi:hypothetical protein
LITRVYCLQHRERDGRDRKDHDSSSSSNWTNSTSGSNCLGVRKKKTPEMAVTTAEAGPTMKSTIHCGKGCVRFVHFYDFSTPVMTKITAFVICNLYGTRASPGTGGEEISSDRATRMHMYLLGCGKTSGAAFWTHMVPIFPIPL